MFVCSVFVFFLHVINTVVMSTDIHVNIGYVEQYTILYMI